MTELKKHNAKTTTKNRIYTNILTMVRMIERETQRLFVMVRFFLARATVIAKPTRMIWTHPNSVDSLRKVKPSWRLCLLPSWSTRLGM